MYFLIQSINEEPFCNRIEQGVAYRCFATTLVRFVVQGYPPAIAALDMRGMRSRYQRALHGSLSGFVTADMGESLACVGRLFTKPQAP